MFEGVKYLNQVKTSPSVHVLGNAVAVFVQDMETILLSVTEVEHDC